MRHYVHHVPGRIRVRIPAMKRNPVRAAQVKTGLEAIPGVLECEVNELTGSVTARYNRDITNAEEITRTLSRLGAMAAVPVLSNAAGNGMFSGAQLYKASGSVGKFIVSFAVEKLVERSALALVGAIL